MQLKKYTSLFGALAKASFIADLEYRANFILRVVTDIFWYLAQIMTFEVLYRQTNVIGHWTLEQTRVFLGVLFVVDSFYMLLLQDNLDRFSEKIRKGELDLLLAKPIDSQFLISFQRVATASLGNMAIAVGWLVWSLWSLPDFNWIKLLWLIIMIPNGFMVLYGCRFSLSATAVIFTRSENLQLIWYNLYKLGMKPDSIYFPWLKFLLLTALPVGVIASVPARTLLDPPNIGLALWSLFLGPFLVYLSTKYWTYCLKHYSSASS